MARFKVYIEYEGTRYSGWQVQKNARTVQGEILDAAKKIFNTSEIEIYGSGRTDSGVHAIEQVAHLEVRTVLAPEIIRMKLNDELPADVNVIEVEKASGNFHARHDAKGRSYLYQISRRRTAFGKRYVWWIKDNLDFTRMQNAARLFVGMKNLASFTHDDESDKSTKVLIEGIEMKETGDLILIRISGSHFLWKMVRQIVGVLAEVGRGKLSVDKVSQFIRTKSDEPARYTAPPSGLFLEKVFYQTDKRNIPLEPTINMKRSHPEKK